MGGLSVRPTAPAIMDGSRIYTRNRVRQEHWDQPGRRQGRSCTADISRTLPRQRFPRIEMQLGSFSLYCCFAVTAIESDFPISDTQLTNKALPYTGAFPHYCSLNYHLILDCRGQIVYYLGSFFASVVYGQCIISV